MKTAKSVLLSLLCLVALFVMIPALLLAGFVALVREDTEHQRIPSPDGSRYAVVIESNQGAMGGATYVEVADTPRQFLFFSLEGKRRRIYTGRWGEHESIQVCWQDSNTLLIHGKIYEIPPTS